jgi:hypothetical protein
VAGHRSRCGSSRAYRLGGRQEKHLKIAPAPEAELNPSYRYAVSLSGPVHLAGAVTTKMSTMARITDTAIDNRYHLSIAAS